MHLKEKTNQTAKHKQDGKSSWELHGILVLSHFSHLFCFDIFVKAFGCCGENAVFTTLIVVCVRTCLCMNVARQGFRIDPVQVHHINMFIRHFQGPRIHFWRS